MRLKCAKSKNSEHYCIIQDLNVNGKRTTKVFENIGNYESLCARAGDQDPFEWAKEYVASINKKHKEDVLPSVISKSPATLIEKGQIKSFNVGFLFLQDIYHKLGLHKISKEIKDRHQFKYDFNNILSHLIYLRVVAPGSKKKAHEDASNLLFSKSFDLQHTYRCLDVIAEESDFIQAELYKNSKNYKKRNDGVLYYDCTNYFFEIEEASGLRQYGKSKENRPSPIVQMGLFLDADGIPLAFNINAGNTNEQVTLKPLEKQIIKDFEHSKFVVCTDAGLSSAANRKFNSIDNRAFVTTQSLKKLKKHIQDDMLDLTKGWKLAGSDKTYDISILREDITEENEDIFNVFKDKTFYKERPMDEKDLKQRLIVTYSYKYQQYCRNIRSGQIERALTMINKGKSGVKKPRPNDPSRFINTITCTTDGELTDETTYSINQEVIGKEAKFDGLYSVCTNLEDTVEDIIKINQRRWEIEESFRIMKTEFAARPVYLSKDNRIKAHFTTCFLALTLYRYLEQKLENKATVSQIVNTLQKMEMLEEREGYIPTYERTDLTDLLHDSFGFRTDYEITRFQDMKKIYNGTKK